MNLKSKKFTFRSMIDYFGQARKFILIKVKMTKTFYSIIYSHWKMDGYMTTFPWTIFPGKLPTPGEAKAKAMPGRLYTHTKIIIIINYK